MMAERGIEVDHSSVHRWVIKLLPVFEKAFRKRKRPVGKSWRVDETYVKVKGQWKYLYRAVDKAGNTVDFLLRAHRDTAAARRYFEKAIEQNDEPETITVDKSGANLAALEALQCQTFNADQGPAKQISEQRRRAGSPGHQTHHQTNDGVQGFSVCAHHPVWHRDRAHDPQGADV
jgi:transposase-like protein